MPKVSVVIASYQHEKFVRQCIESVLTQSFTDFEIVVTDDGSKDGTADVIRSIEDPRIQLAVFPENRGACIAMNDAIARATGTYVAILNSDDYFLPGKLEHQVRVLDQRPDLAAVFALPTIVDERGAPLDDHPLLKVFQAKTQTRHQWLRHFFFHGNALCHPTLMIRRQCYAELGKYDPRLAQLPDFDMWIRLCGRYEFEVLPDRMTAFRILDNEANASGSRPETHARTTWEFGRLLDTYTTMSETDFRLVFADDLSHFGYTDLPMDVALARLALKINIPCHQLFGLNLLHDAVGRGLTGIDTRELSELAKIVDPFNVQGRLRAAELKKSLAKTGFNNLTQWTAKNYRGLAPLRFVVRQARRFASRMGVT